LNSNVGIGTTNPLAKLYVVSTNVAPTLSSVLGQVVAVDQSAGRLSAIGSQADIILDATANSANQKMLQMVNVSNYFTLRTVTDAGALNSNLLAINLNNGNVGIGTTNPTEKLDVVGNLKVSGTITQGGTGLLDGSGTANYVSKWSDSDTLTSSLIYDNGTNVGIGTTNPGSYKLNVNGSVYIQGGSVLLSSCGNTVSANGAYFPCGDYSFTSWSGGVTYYPMIIKGGTNGNVGIGTTSPGAKLEVNGSIAPAYSYGLESSNTLTGFYPYKSAIGANDTVIRYSTGNNNFVIQHASTNVLAINQDGNVGIGTTAPADSILTINANSANTSTAGGISLLGLNKDYGMRTTVYDTGTGIQGQFVLKVAGSYDAAPTMVIGGPGNTRNVGIGTTAPGYKLEVAGDSKTTTYGWFRGSSDGSNATVLRLGRLVDAESPLVDVYADDSGGDILRFKIGRYTSNYKFDYSGPSTSKGVEFNSLDGEPVYIFFLLVFIF